MNLNDMFGDQEIDIECDCGETALNDFEGLCKDLKF